MNKQINYWKARYAVIKALHIERGRERFVIAYPNEQSLRHVIAGSSVIALGFPSREKAVARTGFFFSTVAT